MVGTIAAALQHWVPHGGGLLGAGLPIFLPFLYRLGLRLATTSRVGEGGLPHRLSLVRPVQPSGVVLIVLMAQSNQSGPLEVVFEFFSC